LGKRQYNILLIKEELRCLVVFEPKILFKLSNIPIPAPIPGISFPPDLNKLIPT
jgi:hypothetical protein